MTDQTPAEPQALSAEEALPPWHHEKPWSALELDDIRRNWTEHPERFGYMAGRWLATLRAASRESAGAGGLTKQELLDLFDRAAGQPLIRDAIRRTLQPAATRESAGAGLPTREDELAALLFETEPPLPGGPSGHTPWEDLPSGRRFFWHDWAARLAAAHHPVAEEEGR